MKLIELLRNSEPILERDLDDDWYDGEIESIADYLIKNGVIVPPCKVGDTVYGIKGCFFLPHATKIKHNDIIPCEVIGIKKVKKGEFILLKPLLDEAFNKRSANTWFPFSALGKTVFLTLEEAEQALKERESN